MFLLLRESFTNSSALVIIGKRMTRKTFEPKLATFSATYLLAPCTMETTIIKVETDRITPSRVRKDRSLCERKVSKAIIIGSFRDTLRRDDRSTPWSAVAVCFNEVLSSAGVGICISKREVCLSLSFPGIQDENLSHWFHIIRKISFLLDGPQHLWFDECIHVSENRRIRMWACGAAGSALPWHGRGRRFDPDQVHHFTRLESITSRAFARIVQKSYNRPDSGDRKCSLFTRVITRPPSTPISIIGAAAARNGYEERSMMVG